VDDLEWLRKLDRELWPKSKGQNPVKQDLTREEFERVLACIAKYKLVAEMYSTNMFGGYGMRLYEHEPYPDHIAGNVKEMSPRLPGCGRDDAWEIFSKFTPLPQ